MNSLLQELLNRATSTIKRARSPQPDLERQLGPVTQSVMPMFPGGLNKLPTAPKLPTTPAMETLGEMSPEFTAVGGESMYNMGRPSPKTFADPAYEAYMRLFAKGGR